MLGANGIVGAGIGIATGAALSALMRNSSQVALCFFGEGAVNQGIFLECGNMAALWKLPLILLCENNQFAMSTRPAETTAGPDLAQRAAGFGIPGMRLDGTDVLAVFDAVHLAACKARKGEGPSFLEAICYRYEGHFSGDNLQYRVKEERALWVEKDPILNLQGLLLAEKLLAPHDVEGMVETAERSIDEALDFAKNSPFPDPATASEDLYA